MSKSDLIDVEMQIHVETDKAIGVSDDGNKANLVWLPKSQVEFVRSKPNSSPNVVTVTLPEWLAMDKGLI